MGTERLSTLFLEDFQVVKALSSSIEILNQSYSEQEVELDCLKSQAQSSTSMI